MNKENKTIIKALNIYGRIPEQWELLEEIEKLSNIINKAISFININQNEKTLSLNYEQLKKLRGILRNDEFYLMLFDEQLQELKESDKK